MSLPQSTTIRCPESLIRAYYGIDEGRSQFGGRNGRLEFQQSVSDVDTSMNRAGANEHGLAGSDNLARIVHPHLGGALDNGENFLELVRVARRAYAGRHSWFNSASPETLPVGSAIS